MKRGQAAPYQGGQKSFAESAIPLVLIAILAVFIAGKLNLIDMSGIPGVGALFPAPSMKVAVVGHATPSLKALLASEDYHQAGVYYAVGDIPEKTLYPGTLDSFDVVVLQGERSCSRTARKVIADYVKSGKKLIVIGDACTETPDDPTIGGWDWPANTLGDVMPVDSGKTIARVPVPGTAQVYPDGEFKIIVPGDHPIFPSAQRNFKFAGTLWAVYPNKNSNILAVVTSYGGRATAPSTWAVVESKGFTSGKVVYFAFDPSTIPARSILLNTITYLKGVKA